MMRRAVRALTREMMFSADHAAILPGSLVDAERAERSETQTLMPEADVETEFFRQVRFALEALEAFLIRRIDVAWAAHEIAGDLLRLDDAFQLIDGIATRRPDERGPLGAE